MSKLYLADPNSYDVKIGKIKRHFAHKVDVYPPGSCPLTYLWKMCPLSRWSSVGGQIIAEGGRWRSDTEDA